MLGKSRDLSLCFLKVHWESTAPGKGSTKLEGRYLVQKSNYRHYTVPLKMGSFVIVKSNRVQGPKNSRHIP